MTIRIVGPQTTSPARPARAPLAALGLAAALAACSSDPGAPPTPPAPDASVVAYADAGVALPPATPPAALDKQALALEASPACLLDGDCAAGQRCFQNVCATASADTRAIAEVAPGLSIVSASTRVQRIRAGQSTVQVSLQLSGAVPAEGLAYRLERTDADPATPPVVARAQGSGDTVSLEIPVGAASPDAAEPAEVAVNLVTAAGTERFVFAPQYSEDGRYGGDVVLGTFGQLGLPIELSIVTDPAGAPIAQASAAYLVLPIEAGNLWNPMAPSTNGPTQVTRRLEWDDFTRKWVARFELPYTLPATSPFTWVTAGSNHVSRNLRFELEVQGEGLVTGNVSDRWSGLIEERSTGGVLRPADVLFEGTVALHRLAAPPALADVTPPVEYPAGSAADLPYPALDACAVVTFDVACAGIASTADFLAASPGDQATCALAMADASMASGTTVEQIQAYLDDATPDPSNGSFADFMRDCAAQRNGTCVPSDAVLCSRELAAGALKVLPEGDTRAVDLLRAYQRTTREAFLGRQFAAFYADADTRLAWLKAQDYPAIVTSAVQSLVERLLEDWRVQVLEAHVTVLDGLFDSAGGAVLGQEISDASALDAQRQLLFETSQSWRGAADALALGAARWHTLLTDGATRTAKASYVFDRAFDLYVVAGTLAELNRRAGSGGNNAVFEGGFRALMREVRDLSLPFDRLVYQRQGEVVVSTSLDPTATNDTLLARLEADARSEVDRADTAVTEVLAEAQAELLSQAELTARLTTEVGELESDLAELCGLPQGCTAPNATTCAPATELGRCGFVRDAAGNILDAYPDSANTSEAGAAILDVRAALLDVTRAEEAVRAHAAKLQLSLATTNAFAGQVDAWNMQRRTLVSDIRSKVEQLMASRDSTLAMLAENIASQAALRATRLDAQADFVETWDDTAVEGADDNLDRLAEVAIYQSLSSGLTSTADAIDQKAEAIAEGMPKVTGMANDVSAPYRLITLMSNYYVTTAMRAGALAASTQASRLERQRVYEQQLLQAELKKLELDDQLSAATTEAEVEALRNQAQLVTAASELEQGIVREVVELLENETNAALAYERDLVELRDRRDQVQAETVEMAGLGIQVLQAELNVERALSQYERVVQRAQLVAGRLTNVRAQAENINQIVGSPAVVFAWANRLTRAEQRLERAKDVLSEWLVALEYFAVRPFMDQRIQLLLAKNTTQLGQIADELKRLQASCGGPQNTEVVELSVREDLLGITGPSVDLATGAERSAAERFRAVLQAGRIPIDKRVRHSTDATVGDLLNRTGILAATFSLSADAFANLETTCNAKVASIAVELVGQDLGSARPTVSILYDGTSQLRSCQPDIRELVETIGADVTPFGELTELRTVGRSVSPVAGVNTMGSKNLSLGGLPLVSQYTVLIDPTAGENQRIDWSKVEDVRLAVEYTYQDLFPSGQCQ